VGDLCRAFHEASAVKDKPSCILAKTFKGRGIPTVEDADDWHGKPLGSAKTEPALTSIQAQISSLEPHGITPQLPSDSVEDIPFGGLTMSEPPSYKLGDKV
jgi:transketolase